MSFMEPYVWEGKFIEVGYHGEGCSLDATILGETEGPGDWIGNWPATDDEWERLSEDEKHVLIKRVHDYLHWPTIDEEKIDYIKGRNGWGCWLSASGYMDRTELSVFPTEREARLYLESEYDICRICGTEIEEEDGCDCLYEVESYNSGEPWGEMWCVVTKGDQPRTVRGRFKDQEAADKWLSNCYDVHTTGTVEFCLFSEDNKHNINREAAPIIDRYGQVEVICQYCSRTTTIEIREEDIQW